MKKGIDVSHWQGKIDWTAVKNSDVEFAILKAGGSDSGFYTDTNFEQNYAGAKAVGMPVGAYFYVGPNCTSREDGIADAKRFLEIIKGKQFEYPVYIDVEESATSAKAGATDACIGFCQTMEQAGYYCGIYASDISGFADRLDISRLDASDKWVARYGSKPSYVKSYGIWQSSSTGKIPGIVGNVDINESYKDYPQIIKSKGLNGFEKTSDPVQQTVAVKKTLNIIIELEDHKYSGLLEEI